MFNCNFKAQLINAGTLCVGQYDFLLPILVPHLAWFFPCPQTVSIKAACEGVCMGIDDSTFHSGLWSLSMDVALEFKFNDIVSFRNRTLISIASKS